MQFETLETSSIMATMPALFPSGGEDPYAHNFEILSVELHTIFNGNLQEKKMIAEEICIEDPLMICARSTSMFYVLGWRCRRRRCRRRRCQSWSRCRKSVAVQEVGLASASDYFFMHPIHIHNTMTITKVYFFMSRVG